MEKRTYRSVAEPRFVYKAAKNINDNDIPDLIDGKIPASQLPSFVDDVIEGYYFNAKFYTDAGHTHEITPEKGKIYVDVLTNVSYRWSGTEYVSIATKLYVHHVTVRKEANDTNNYVTLYLNLRTNENLTIVKLNQHLLPAGTMSTSAEAPLPALGKIVKSGETNPTVIVGVYAEAQTNHLVCVLGDFTTANLDLTNGVITDTIAEL